MTPLEEKVGYDWEFDKPSTWPPKWRRVFVCTMPVSVVLFFLAVVLAWALIVALLPVILLVKWGSDLWPSPTTPEGRG